MKTMTRITALTTLILATGFAGMAAADRGGMPGRGMEIDFSALDTNSDDMLNRTELTAQATERLTVIDLDGDGVLTRVELAASFPNRGGPLTNLFGPDRSERMADRILAMHGATESGQVSVGDLVTLRVNALFARADENADGLISATELEQMSTFRGNGQRREHGRGHDRDHARMEGHGWKARGNGGPEMSPPTDATPE